jgi:amidase
VPARPELRHLRRDAAPPRRPGRLLAARDAFAFADDAARPLLEQALARVAAILGDVEEIKAGDEPLEQWMDCFRFPQGEEAWAAHREWITRVKPEFGPAVGPRFQWAATVKAEDVERARARREQIARRMDTLLEGDAVLALPSAPGIALPRGSAPQVVDGLRARALPMLCIAGLARLPQVSLPLATLDGCPLGLSLIAARNNDTMLLAIARAVSSQPPAVSKDGGKA